ncbi:MAG: hypothetical protein ACKVU2_04170 [Saprospiraceae bacterium]
MKKTIIIVLALLPAFTFGQAAIQKSIALSSSYDAGHELIPVSSGGYAIFGRQTLSLGAKTDVFYLRVDAQGNQTAYKIYGDGNASETFGKGVVALQNGWLLVGSKTVIGSSGWMLRTNAAGDLLWSKTVAGTTRINQVVPLPDGRLLATGQATGGLMFLMELTEDGTIIWQQNYTSGEGRDLYVTMGGNACVVLGGTQIWKIHLASRQLQWEKPVVPPTFGPTNRTEFLVLNGIVQVDKGQFAIIGSAYTDLITELHSGHFAAVWSESGVPLWQKFLHETTNSSYDQNEGFSIFTLPNTKTILFAGSDDGKIAITRTDLKGKVVEDTEITAPGPILGLSLIKEAGFYAMTGAVLTGSVNTYFYRSGSNDLAKIAAPQPGSESGNRAENFRVIHQPDAARLTVETSTVAEREGVFQLLDVSGRVVWEKKVGLAAGDNRLELETGRLTPGLYWLRDLRGNEPARAFMQP